MVNSFIYWLREFHFLFSISSQSRNTSCSFQCNPCRPDCTSFLHTIQGQGFIIYVIYPTSFVEYSLSIYLLHSLTMKCCSHVLNLPILVFFNTQKQKKNSFSSSKHFISIEQHKMYTRIIQRKIPSGNCCDDEIISTFHNFQPCTAMRVNM